MSDNFSKQELIVGEWIKRAQDDELNARSILTHRDGTPGGACFLSQQIAEKYLKAFLVEKKGEFPKVHHLEYLLKICAEINNDFVLLKDDAVLLSDFYVESRYPGNYPEFTWQEAEKAYESAGKIKEFVLLKIK